MARTPRPPRDKPTVTERLAHWRQGLGSSVRRYSQEVLADAARVHRARAAHPHAPHDSTPAAELIDGFADRWHSAPSGPGLTAAAWLGHCSVLLKVDGQTILTDPVLSHKIGVRLGPLMIGPRRLGLTLPPHALPPADLILISHAHYDHLDKPTLRALANSRTALVTAANTARLIPRGFGEVHELPWDAHLAVHGISLNALRPRHWGARTAWDRHRGFNSYLLSGKLSPAQRVLFAGDTAMTNTYSGAGPVELAIMGIGAYRPWVHAHATPEQALEMAQQAGARRFLPVHHSTFKLSDEPLDEPMQRLRTAAAGSTISVLDAAVGQVIHLLPPVPATP